MMKSRLSDRDDWFDIWFDDKQGMMDVMAHNMASDLSAGYDYFGHAMREAREQLEAYKAKFDAEMDAFKLMDENMVNRWCFYDMKKRGAIE